MRQICRDYGLSHHTVAKMLENVEPPGYQQGQGERPRPKLGPFLGVIDQILEVDKTAPEEAAPHRQEHLRAPARRARLPGFRESGPALLGRERPPPP